jgi:hypothetical protein
MSCFPLGAMNGLTYAQLLKYSKAASVFKRVENYNTKVAALRSAGDLSQTYYEFQNTDEQAQYKLGLFLLVQNDLAYANYKPVQKI